MTYCAWCSDDFVATSLKQIYCSPECRQLASKEKIMDRYHIEKRKKRIAKKRLCAGGCETPLSIYNDSGMCDNCLTHNKKMKNFMREIKGYFDYEGN